MTKENKDEILAHDPIGRKLDNMMEKLDDHIMDLTKVPSGSRYEVARMLSASVGKEFSMDGVPRSNWQYHINSTIVDILLTKLSFQVYRRGAYRRSPEDEVTGINMNPNTINFLISHHEVFNHQARMSDEIQFMGIKVYRTFDMPEWEILVF